MKPSLTLLFAVVAIVGATGAVAAANGQNSPPPWIGNETANNSTSISPGQQLAGAVGAQGASLEGELWNRTLSERLANATTSAERAEVVAEEVETIEASIDALNDTRANLTEAWEDGEMSEGEYRTALSAFVVRARTVELRANQTARAAESLPVSVQLSHEINTTRVRALADRAHDLYQFEGEVGQEVANATLANQSALVSTG